MKNTLLLIYFFCTIATSVNAQDEVYLDRIVGGNSDGSGIIAGEPLEFKFNFRNVSYSITGFTNGFQVYSPDGATWEPLSGTLDNDYASNFDGGWNVKFYSNTVSDIDTVGFLLWALFKSGTPVGTDQYVLSIYTQTLEEDLGKDLCIDSCFYPPASVWLWASNGNGEVVPAWDGPLCFDIVECCTGITGDMNYDDNIDIADLTTLVNWQFKGGPELYCVEEANVNGGPEIDISDLTYYVNFLFKSGPAPVACP